MKKLLFAAAAVWLLAACNKELGPEYETPPVFDEVTFTTATQPDKITEPVKVDEVVWVNATVSCPYKVKQVWLAYFVDGDESNCGDDYAFQLRRHHRYVQGADSGTEGRSESVVSGAYPFRLCLHVDPDVYL